MVRGCLGVRNRTGGSGCGSRCSVTGLIVIDSPKSFPQRQHRRWQCPPGPRCTEITVRLYRKGRLVDQLATHTLRVPGPACPLAGISSAPEERFITNPVAAFSRTASMPSMTLAANFPPARAAMACCGRRRSNSGSALRTGLVQRARISETGHRGDPRRVQRFQAGRIHQPGRRGVPQTAMGTWGRCPAVC